jgi:hypothetical protein
MTAITLFSGLCHTSLPLFYPCLFCSLSSTELRRGRHAGKKRPQAAITATTAEPKEGLNRCLPNEGGRHVGRVFALNRLVLALLR